MNKRVILIVLDSLGIGELPDAILYGDVGSNTIGNIYKRCSDMALPHLIHLGLGNIDGCTIPVKAIKPNGCYGKSNEQSPGKDTTTGHWEMSGIILTHPFPIYPNGFPEEIIHEFEAQIKRKVIGNKAISGTEIICELGEEHIKTGKPIVYTSADSVFQIAAHEDILSIDELYTICKKARIILNGKHAVGRVIARPFKGHPGNFYRTTDRKDFSLDPLEETMLDHLKMSRYDVMAIGKIGDIFNMRGITNSQHTRNNDESILRILETMNQEFSGLVFANLVDFDMLYGHRNDARGYCSALESFDHAIPEMINRLNEEDILIITADHGCDPTTDSTDHSREYIPILVYGKKIKQNVNLGIRDTFSDISATITEYFHLPPLKNGQSFLSMIKG